MPQSKARPSADWSARTLASSGRRATGRIASANGAAVGGLVGENSGLISHVGFEGEVANRNSAGKYGGSLGGLVGMNSSKGARIEHAIGRATVRGDDAVAGGLVGVNAVGAQISDSLATGEVWSDSFLAGGLVGLNAESRILRSEATGPVVANGEHHNILVGLNLGEDSDIADSKATYTPPLTAVRRGKARIGPASAMCPIR